ncbi:MAG: DUF3825 domain-containing protein [Candidatus Binatus sp.]|jgi:hypothetical protein
MPTNYTSLVKRYREQPTTEVFAHFGYRGDEGESWETPYEKLARMAKPEEWNYQRSQFKRPGQAFPILTSYVNYTFLRLQQLDRISYSADDSRACFNTGLQTPNEKDIFVTFFRNKNAEEREQPTWTHFGFFDSYSERLADFRPLPEIATYIRDPAELVFDTSYEFEINFDHIFDQNRDRLPEVLRDNSTLAISAIKGSLDLLKQKIIRNYKIAIPHWHDNKMQLLLPLNLTSENEADLALVADKDSTGRIYRIRTVLTMDMAYVDARLITRPDREWLNP